MDFHLRGRLSVTKIERFIRAIKIIALDVALLVLFVVFLLRIVRQELGW